MNPFNMIEGRYEPVSAANTEEGNSTGNVEPPQSQIDADAAFARELQMLEAGGRRGIRTGGHRPAGHGNAMSLLNQQMGQPAGPRPPFTDDNANRNTTDARVAEATQGFRDPANARFTLSVICFVNIPQIIAAGFVLSEHWNEAVCDKPLREWALFSSFRMACLVIVSSAIYFGKFFGRYPALDLMRPLHNQMGPLLHKSKYCLDMLGLLWFVVGNLWVFNSKTCPSASPAIYRLCLSMVLISHGMIFLPCLIVVMVLPFLCLCFPCLVRLLARMRDPMHGKGATDAAINKLETEAFSEGKDGADADNGRCCAICLSDFEEGDKLRVMKCSHRFHKSCVDEWLRVNASCPSCRCDISGAAPTEPSNATLGSSSSADGSGNSNSEANADSATQEGSGGSGGDAGTVVVVETGDDTNMSATNPLNSNSLPLHTI